MAVGKERGFQHWLKNREKFFYALVALIIKVLFDLVGSFNGQIITGDLEIYIGENCLYTTLRPVLFHSSADSEIIHYFYV